MDLKALPKAELHCHLDGVLDLTMLQAIRRDDPFFPIDPAEFERAYPVQDFESFIRWWAFIDPIKGALGHFCPIFGRHIQRLKAQNVCYAEVMIASGELPEDTVEAVEAVGALREWVNRQEAGRTQVEFLVAIGRTLPAEMVAKRGEKIIKLYEAGLVVGVALAGIEQGYPVKPFRKTFDRFHEAGLGVEIHAGEWCGPESVWDALEHGRPDRIGHGVSLFKDPALIDLVRERDIHIEVCLTSNLKTGSISRIERHPIGRARQLGLNFSINTDDPGPFQCSMTSEYGLAAQVFGFTERDLWKVCSNAIGARFQERLWINDTCGIFIKSDNREAFRNDSL